MVCALLACAPQASAAEASASLCPAGRYDTTAFARSVFDGDTLELSDGTKLRLGGINTPEIGRDGHPSDPFAEAAFHYLLELTGRGQRLNLRFDTELRDHYGRLLAHVFLADGTNVQAALLRRGLATTLVVPPNEWSHSCYARVEARARAERRGIWSLPRYQAVPVDEMEMAIRGYRIVTGVVRRVGEGRRNLWLNLSPAFALRVPRDDLDNFRDIDLHRLTGRRVEARGWVGKRKQQLRMTVRHPAALRLMD